MYTLTDVSMYALTDEMLEKTIIETPTMHCSEHCTVNP